jgi:hypothetical protein
MSIPNYVTALANHSGVAFVDVKGMTIPVKIMDIQHESSPYSGDETTFKCMAVNLNEIAVRTENAMEQVREQVKRTMNCIYGAPRPGKVNDLVIENVKFGATTTITWKDGTETAIVWPDGACCNSYKEYSLALCLTLRRLGITRVIFNDPATIVIWADGTKTVVKCQEGDIYHMEGGLTRCIAKKMFGNKGNFNDVFHKWIPEED